MELFDFHLANGNVISQKEVAKPTILEQIVKATLKQDAKRLKMLNDIEIIMPCDV